MVILESFIAFLEHNFINSVTVYLVMVLWQQCCVVASSYYLLVTESITPS